MSAYLISVVVNLKNGLFYDHFAVGSSRVSLCVCICKIRWLEISRMGFLCRRGDMFNSSFLGIGG